MALDIKKLNYDIDQILNHFELERHYNCGALSDWLTVKIPADYTLHEFLEAKRQQLTHEGEMWNEEELKMHFLSFVFLFAEMEVSKRIKLFYERTIAAKVNQTPLSVKCDAMLAAPLGLNTPTKPYFFMQEFKKGKKSVDDAEGQMLVAMLIAQTLNADKKPVYGCWIQGKDWHFTTLDGKNYCFSQTYDASITKELIEILFILRRLKEIVL